ncbi:uncharacterized protein LOC129571346 [Sitodiplosis mosellana]|uniref:uncharacterized protein LOC129571346 n=1 Tax=Sitodiplosis mosellana TaxID=263140 RepID=UPI00244384C5|nr:uncharacterized protein LOC129571346 [Sitodiplosis mosellana]
MSEQTGPLTEIRNFTEFLEQHLNRKVLEYSLKALTKPGDNFGAVVQSVDVKVAGNDLSDEPEHLHVVVKTPVTSPYLAELFKPAISFVKEVRFYSDIIPAVKQFEQTTNVPEDERLDAFIQSLGWRISLDPSAQSADSDAVLLLENVKLQNFANGDKSIGFGRDEAMATLKALAKFHALCIAMRRLQPELFNTKVNPYLLPLDATTKNDKQFESIYRELRLLDGLSPEMRNKIENVTRNGKEYNEILTRAPDSPYTTVVHKDLWINNIMTKRDATPTKVKIYDFQSFYFESFMHDLIFFLFTSVQNSDLKSNFKSLIDHYLAEFRKTMDFFKCPLDDYTSEKMWSEIRDKAHILLFRLLIRAKVTKANHDSTPQLHEVNKRNSPMERPASKVVLDQWKFIIDMFIENAFI